MVELSDTEIVTEPCRLAFPALFKPKPTTKGGTDLKYQAALLLPPDYDMTGLVECVKAAMVKKWGKVIKLVGKNNPLRKCDDLDEDDHATGYDAGWRFINTKSGYQPSVLDQKKQEVLDEKKVYPGMWVRAHLSAFAWEHAQGGKGVSFSINAVQLVKDDTRLDGRKNAKDVFGEIETGDLGDIAAPDGGGSTEETDDLLG